MDQFEDALDSSGFPIREVPAVLGSRMRRGGVAVDLHQRIVIGSDHWTPVRCLCGIEAMTPTEVIPDWSVPDESGVHFAFCSMCMSDMRDGHAPGYSRRRQRRRHH